MVLGDYRDYNAGTKIGNEPGYRGQALLNPDERHTMKTKMILTAAVVGWVCAAAAENYDFYDGMRYPGAKLRPDVDLYKVKQAGESDPKAYERREVVWWPRKGVDIIEVNNGMPLRTWTRRSGEPKQFEAHLVGLRGMGNTMSSKYGGRDGGPIEPGVVLRLPDGRKRCFPRGSFGDEDKKYIMDLYLKEMKRIKAGMDKTKFVKRPDADVAWPDNAKPGEPGTMQVECEHFIWLSGSQAGSDGDPWVNEKEPDAAQWFRNGSIECAEYWWALNEYAGHLMPYWDRKEKWKYQITVPGTKRDGYKVIPGYAGGGYGGCGIKGAGGGPWAGTLWHEWGHGALPNSIRMGGGEAQADMHQCLADPSTIKGNHHVKVPWRNVFNASMGYGYTMFYSITGDDPNWGYGWFTSLPHGAEEWGMLQTVARVGKQRGLFSNGILGLGDMFGEYAARLATFDCELEALFRGRYFAPKRSWIETVDQKKGIYRIPLEEAPEAYGVNIVRLAVSEGAQQFAVDFRGLHDPDCYSDWRACIVAVSHDGKRRYSPMWNKGRMTMEYRPGDSAFWLTVAATPTAMYVGKGGSGVALYSGRHAYRYPWSVQLTGCKPGTPARSLDEMGGEPKGAPHANGSGWVADSAKVARTAYVGPNAMVLGSAQVLDRAIVDDYATVTDRAVVSGHARVSGQGVVKDNAKVEGYSRTWLTLEGDTIATVVPKRPGDDELRKSALWANYAMDRDEPHVLEDWYRFKRGADRRYGMLLSPVLSGYLYGGPEFVVDGDHRGFRFDGKARYGELCPRVADLGEITIEITLKREGQAAQTIFDFGSSPDNCLVLKTAADGKPELVATVDGKTVVKLTAQKALPQNRWASLRVEIDGSKASLWLGADKVAEQSSSFRPCDAFPGGQPKRNFLAASRDGSGGFTGVVDRVLVYHAVHENFSKVGKPIRDASTRPTVEYIEALQKQYGNIEELNRKIGELVSKRLKPFDALRAQKDKRERELKERDPAFLQSEKDLAAAKKAVDTRRQELTKQFDELPETVKVQAEMDAMRKTIDELRRKVHTLQRERLDADDQLKALRARNQEADEVGKREIQSKIRDREQTIRDELQASDPNTRELKKLDETYRGMANPLRKKRDLFAAKGTAEAMKKVREAEGAVVTAAEKALLPYKPEALWMFSFNWQGYGGYYNTPYRSYIGDHVRALVGGGEMREDIGFLTGIQKIVSSDDGWSTSVDWDWRMRQEVDGTIKDLPLMQKWINRVRGPVVTEKPKRANDR